MFKWLKNQNDNYWKKIADKIAIKEKQYPIGTKYEVIEELPLPEINILPGAIGIVKDHGADTVLLRFNINDHFARDVWLIYERLESFKIV
jgi:hypothetical protein